jgi:hypothetical protein
VGTAKDPGHRVIKLFSCLSVENKTARVLYGNLKYLTVNFSGAKNYSNIVVYGYEGEVALFGADFNVSTYGGWDTFIALFKGCFGGKLAEHAGKLPEFLHKKVKFGCQEYVAKTKRVKYG